MTGIVIAAGRGIRMRPYSDERPKCMLPVNGTPLLAHTLKALRTAGCERITVVTGHLAGQIEAPGCALVHNADYLRNNILHSLMHARDAFDDDVMISYSDIYAEPWIHQQLAAADGDIVLAVDRDWHGYYVGRRGHPPEEAEKVHVVDAPVPHAIAVGKHLPASPPEGGLCGEFLGLWKMTRQGARRFRERFDSLNADLTLDEPFEAARRWQQAYVTDLLADLIRGGVQVRCLLIERGWVELDLSDDYERLPSMIASQRLVSLEAQ